MKTVKQILEENRKNQSTINESLDLLAESGLLEDTKVALIKRSLTKDPATMTIAERKSLVSFVETLLESKKTKTTPGRPAAYPPEKDIPVVIVLQRKGIRTYPDNQKIALYYSPALDKYVSVPYGPKNDALGIHLSEAGPLIPLAVAAARAAAPRVAAAGRGALSWGKKKLQDYLKKRADKAAAKKEKDTFDAMKKDPSKGAGKGKGKGRGLGGKLAAAAAAGAGALAGAAAAAGSPDVAPRETEKDYQFGRELGKVSGPGPRATVSGQEIDAQRRIFNIKESNNFAIIQKIVEHNIKAHDISFGSDTSKITVNNRIAKKIMAVHESLNSKNKKKLESMLNEDATSFKKAINFAIRS